MTRGLGSRSIQLFVNLRLASSRKIKTRPKRDQKAKYEKPGLLKSGLSFAPFGIQLFS